MYISRVEVNINNRKKMRELTHLGAYHNWVESSFPDEFKENVRTRKLWRIDQINDKVYLLIVSKYPPNIDLLENYGVKHSAEIKNYERFLKTLRKGMRARFRVKLNTVVSKKSKSKGLNIRGRVQPVKSSEQYSFILDRAETNGFKLNYAEFNIVERGYGKFKHENQKPIDLISATYEGILTITDVEKFKKALTHGIGRKKAYGFGMMTVIPIDG